MKTGKHLCKGFLSVVLTLALVLGIIPITPVSMQVQAFAQDAEVSIDSWETLLDTVSGNNGAATVSTEDGITVTLQKDIVTTGTLFIPGDATVTLDLNGHGIRYGGSEYAWVFKINGGGSLTLKDSNPAVDHYITLEDVTIGSITYENARGVAVSDSEPENGTEGEDYIKVTGGYITGGCYNENGGGVYVCCNALFTLEGGTICGNISNWRGGGVFVDSFPDRNTKTAFIMKDGAVSYNTNCGVYLYSNSIMKLDGGFISHNKDIINYGGGISAYSHASITMTGGTISDNYTTGHGGGINFNGDNLNMSGGSITRNTCIKEGGGIYYDGDKFEMSGGSITNNQGEGGLYSYVETIELSGSAAINDNADGKDIVLFNSRDNLSGHVISVKDALTTSKKMNVFMVHYYSQNKGTAYQYQTPCVFAKSSASYQMTQADAEKFAIIPYGDENKTYYVYYNETEHNAELRECEQYATPEATFTADGYNACTLSNLTPEWDYTFYNYFGNISPISAKVIRTDDTGKCTIDNMYGSELKIVKNGNGTDHSSSEEQVISLTHKDQPTFTITQPTSFDGTGCINSTDDIEYSTDDVTWTRYEEGTALNADMYYVRTPASGSILASPKSMIVINAVRITGALKHGQILTAELAEDDLGSYYNYSYYRSYQWYRGDTEDFALDDSNKVGGSSKTYTLGNDDMGKYFRLVMTCGRNENAFSFTSDVVGPVAKADPPSAPHWVRGQANGTTVTVTYPQQDGTKYEYSVDTGTPDWKTSTEFTDMLPGTSYTIRARIKETDYVQASEEGTYSPVTTGLIVSISPNENITDETELTANVQGTADSYTYYWYRDGNQLSNAFSSTYTTSSYDVGHIIKVKAYQKGPSANGEGSISEAVVGKERSVMVDQVNGGSAVVTDPETVTTNAKVTVVATPSAGWQTTKINAARTENASYTIYTEKDSSDPNKYTYTQPGCDVTVTPVFNKVKYTIAAPAAIDNGSVTLAGVTKADVDSASTANNNASIDDIVMLNVSADSGYYLGGLTVRYNDGEDKTYTLDSGITENSDGKYQFTMPAANITAIEPVFTEHSHSITYESDGASIISSCENGDGAHIGSTEATLTIGVPAKTIYGDGKSEYATLTGKDAFNANTGSTVSENDIRYYRAEKDGNAYTKKADEALSAAPVNAGDYIAEITVGQKTAYVGYTIVPETINRVKVTDITVPVAGEALDTTAVSSTEGISLSGVTWTPDGTNAEYVTVYKASLTATIDANHEFADDVTAAINGKTAAVTMNQDGTLTIEYTFAKTALIPAEIIASEKEVEAIYSAEGIGIPSMSIFTITPADDDGAVSYSVTEETGKGSYSNETGKLTVTKCGTFTVTMNVAATDTYAAATESILLTVNKAEPSAILLPTVSAFTYDPETHLSDIELAGGWNWKDDTIIPVVGNNGYPACVAVDDGVYDYSAVEGYDAKEHAVNGLITVPVNAAPVTVPKIASKTYTGQLQTADVLSSALYTVSGNDGGINAGSYKVKLTLKDSGNYKWSDGSETAEKSLAFEITKAKENNLTVSLEGWTYGETANTPGVRADFGADTVSYLYSNAENGTYSADVPVRAGKWYVKATVDGTDNYIGNTDVKDFTIARRPITVTAGSAKERYDGNALTYDNYTYSENGLASGDRFESVTITGSQKEVGTGNNVPSAAKIVNASGEDVTANYDISYESGTLTVLPECDHKLTKTEYAAPSCSKEGNIAYWTCSECKKIFSDALASNKISMEDTVIAKIAHTPAQAVSENSVPATCDTAGSYDAVVKCSVCGEEIQRDKKTISPLGHEFGEWILTKEPTETETGIYTRTCKRDPSHTETKVAPAKNHEHVFIPVGKKEATCTSDGMEAHYKCSGCNLLFSAEDADAVILDETSLIIKGGHKGGTATCCHKAVCEVCHEEYGSLDPANHEGETYTENKRQATCTADGFTGDIYCKSCNSIIENGKIEPATGHHQAAAVKENVVATTCVSDGSYDEVVRCSDCKEIISSTHKTEKAHGHAYGTPSYEWSADGKQCTATATCTNDDCTDETEGHSITESATVTSAVKKDATTTEKGITTYTAAFKNSHFSAQTKDVTDIPVKQNGSGDSGSGNSGSGDSGSGKSSSGGNGTGGNGTDNGTSNGTGGNGSGNSGTGGNGNGTDNGSGNNGSGSGNNETPGKQDEQVKVGDVVTDTTTKSEVKITSDKAGNETAEYVGPANKNSKSTVIPDTVTIGGKTYKITTIRANAFKGSKVTKVTIGKYVKKICAKAFNGSKVTTIIMKTTKLTKKSVKNCLKGTKAKKVTIKVKVGSKTKNKKYRNLYKKYFTAKNAGKKATVK